MFSGFGFHGIGCDADQPDRKWEIQDGDLNTSSIKISTSRQHINESSTATPMFSASTYSMAVVRILHKQNETNNSKMATAIVEIHITLARRHDIKTISAAGHML